MELNWFLAPLWVDILINEWNDGNAWDGCHFVGSLMETKPGDYGGYEQDVDEWCIPLRNEDINNGEHNKRWR